MKYLCLAYYDEKAFEKIPGPEMAAVVAKCRPKDEELKASGHLELVASLAATRSSTCLRPRAGKTIVTDGPYVEAREVLGSFFIIEAADLNEAIRVASKHPAASLGEELGWGIEIRPIVNCLAIEKTGGAAR
jgi:hypothetical protein